MNKNNIKKITFTGIMLALAIVLSSFCQIKLYSDIRLDKLSHKQTHTYNIRGGYRL